MRGKGEELCLQTKTMGAGIKMSDLYSGFLQLSNQEHFLVFVAELIFPKSPKLFLEYGAEKTGYWTGEKSMHGDVSVPDFSIPCIAKFLWFEELI